MMPTKSTVLPLAMGLMMGAMGIAMVHFDMWQGGAAFVLAHVAVLALGGAAALWFARRGKERPRWLHLPRLAHLGRMGAGAALVVGTVCALCVLGLVGMT